MMPTGGNEAAAGAAPRCDRFFFAIRPGAETARAIDAFAEVELPGLRRLKVAHQHVTLALTEDFEEVPDMLVRKLLLAGAEVRAGPFALRLTRLSGSRRSVALCPEGRVPPLAALQRAIAGAMVRHDVPMREGWRFNPHQTLGYRKGEPFTRRIGGFAWEARDFVLVRSHVGLSHHEVIGRWPLPGGGQLPLL